ncbi:B3 domain-containing protein Os12g0592300 isoform X2 [Aegilops tauschii subsp. strangulata]|uniref:B3 domain-containing protein Os12g0592300 isoform X2 n=1 Tax=Aegilops tauschii subsp. strangulata TaxID=200361 RepID=UPI001E1C9EB2|nr:B3 domain-containing protein Os12g0592300 isoform X2 [Aegilops tauschii subsp. strangulata]
MADEMMGEKGCESCKKWQEHYYWEHMDVSKTKFFKLMTQDSQQRFRIPDKFASSFIRQTQSSQGFDLEAPSGETWHVGVTKVANDLFFSSGWGDFVKAHELQENDLLVFTFSGNSSFEVEQYSPSDDSDEDDDNDDDDDDDDDDTSVPSQLIESPHKVSTLRKFSGKTKPRKELRESPNSSSSCDVKHEETEEEESDDDTYADFDYCYSRAAKQLPDDEKSEIIGLASIQPGNPAFMTVLLRAHLQHKNNFLVIPSEFVDEHLHMRSHEVVLLRPNREERWHVRYYQGSSSRGFRGQPWAKFVRENELREGDVCVFELIKGARNEKKLARTTMAIHVARRRKSNGRFALVD